MKTDTIFTQIFKRWPATLFELLRLPSTLTRDYEYDPVEIKKSLRLDGLFRPRRPGLPAYFVEVQFYPLPNFYANLFAKVFGYMNDNPALHDWRAVAIFESRRMEPANVEAFEDLLNSKRVTRIYLDELPLLADPPLGLGILQVIGGPEDQLPGIVERVIEKANRSFPDSASAYKMIELVEEILICRFADLKREEIRKMFRLTDIRKTAVWREAHGEGREEGFAQGDELAKQQVIRNCLAKRMPIREIAELVELPVKDVRRLAKEILGDA